MKRITLSILLSVLPLVGADPPNTPGLTEGQQALNHEIIKNGKEICSFTAAGQGYVIRGYEVEEGFATITLHTRNGILVLSVANPQAMMSYREDREHSEDPWLDHGEVMAAFPADGGAYWIRVISVADARAFAVHDAAGNLLLAVLAPDGILFSGAKPL